MLPHICGVPYLHVNRPLLNWAVIFMFLTIKWKLSLLQTPPLRTVSLVPNTASFIHTLPSNKGHFPAMHLINMHDLPAKNQWTGTRTFTAAGNRTCIITLRLSDFKSETSLTLLLRHYELTNENYTYFLTNQSKTKTFIDLKVTRNPKPTKNSTRPYLNEIPAHFTHEIKTKGYDVIGVNCSCAS